MASLVLKNVSKCFLGNNAKSDGFAVKNFNITIADKEFVVLVGPSGCGKSTTLQMIAGLEELTSGEIYLDDKLLNEVPPKDRDIAMVFQTYALYPHMTVYENMAFALKLQKKSKEEIDRRVQDAANILGITDYLGRKPSKLSGGEQQRVAIGRAIVRNPKVFLMDEPLSNLDAKLRNQMRAEIIRLHKQINTTFIYVTHDQTEAMTLGDRIVVMKDGCIQQVGTPREIFDFPANTFVAGFIGTPPMNLVSGHIQGDGGGKYYICWGDYRFPVPEKVLAAMNRQTGPVQRDVMIGFRPEHSVVFWKMQEECICATVEISEMLGSEMQIHVKYADDSVILRVPILSVPDYMREFIPLDTPVYFKILTEYVRLFDSESGEALYPVKESNDIA